MAMQSHWRKLRISYKLNSDRMSQNPVKLKHGFLSGSKRPVGRSDLHIKASYCLKTESAEKMLEVLNHCL